MPCPTLCVTVQGVSNVSSTRKRLSPLRPFLLVTTKWIGSGTCLNLRSANSRECDRQLPAAALCSPASDRPWPFHSGTDSSTEKRRAGRHAPHVVIARSLRSGNPERVVVQALDHHASLGLTG
eukprot:gene23048-28030_t